MGIIIMGGVLLYIASSLVLLWVVYSASKAYAKTIYGKVASVLVAVVVVLWYPFIRDEISHYRFKKYASKIIMREVYITVTEVDSVRFCGDALDYIYLVLHGGIDPKKSTEMLGHYCIIEKCRSDGTIQYIDIHNNTIENNQYVSKYNVKLTSEKVDEDYSLHTLEITKSDNTVVAVCRQAIWHGARSWIPYPDFQSHHGVVDAIPPDVDFVKFVHEVLRSRCVQ
jgi:hypothetical protein